MSVVNSDSKPSKFSITVKITEQHKKLIDECFRYGIIRPNEYNAIKEYLLEQEISIRRFRHNDKWFGLNGKLNKFNEVAEVSDVYYSLRKRRFSKLGIAKYQTSDLYNVNRFYTKTYAVRRVADMIKETEEVYVDSDIIRSLQWLIDNRQHMYDLIERYKHCLSVN